MNSDESSQRTSVVASQDLEVLKLTQEEYAQTIGVVNRRDSYEKRYYPTQRLMDSKEDGEISRQLYFRSAGILSARDVVAEIGAVMMALIVRGLVDAIRPVERKIAKSKEHGRSVEHFDIVIATLTFGKCIGASVVLDPFHPRYPATLKCTTAVEMLLIGKEAFDLGKISSGVMSSSWLSISQHRCVYACDRGQAQAC